MVAAELVNQRDGFSAVVASTYGPSAPPLRHELGEDLVKLRGAYPDSPMLNGGDLNVTLQANDRPNGGGGRDPRSRQLREVIASLGLEMGPWDWRFTWRGSAPNHVWTYSYVPKSYWRPFHWPKSRPSLGLYQTILLSCGLHKWATRSQLISR